MNAWVLILGIVVIAVILGYFSAQKQKELLSEGKIAKRDMGFEDYAEIFTIRDVSFSEIWAELKTADYSGKVNGSADVANERVVYKGSDWEAHLYHMKEEQERNAYCFEFLKWRTHNGITQSATDMNIVLTTIEKVFLKIDPNTQVSKRKNITKSKPKFF